MWAPPTTGRARSGIVTSPNSRAWPSEQCKTYIAGIPQTGAPTGEIICPPYPTHPDLVVWPESPAPFFGDDPRFQQAMHSVAAATHAPLVVGGIGMDFVAQQENAWNDYNSAFIVDADGKLRRPLRQNPPRPLRRVHSLPESAHVCAQAHRPRFVFHAWHATTESFCSIRKTAGGIATASSSAMKLFSPTRCASSRATAPKSS